MWSDLTSGHGGGPGGSYGTPSPHQLRLGDVDPSEVSGPGESSHLEVVPIAVIVLQGLVVDHVDDWDDEGEGVLLDPGEERLEPAGVTLAVTVQEEDHVPRGGPGPRQPGPDQPLSLGEPHQLDLAGQEPVYVPLQLALATHVNTQPPDRHQHSP